jgi:integrase
MKGRVYRRGGTWSYRFDVDPDPLTGRRRQTSKGGFRTEREAWQVCRAAMRDYERGRHVRQSRRTVEEALTEWLGRIRHSLKPSMAKHWQNYIAYYVIPHIGRRPVQEVDGSVCDALYAKLLAEGRIKARPRSASKPAPVHVRRFSATGRDLPCRPYRYDEVRCYRVHTADDPLLGKPIAAKPGAARSPGPQVRPGLEPKTVVNAHRMLHRAWEDFTAWGWAKRNVVRDAHPPYVPRRGRKIWSVAQLRTFLQLARQDRFFALWVLEATSGMRRSELAGARADRLDFDAGTLTLDRTRVVVDGRVIESDGKTENAQRIVVLDPLTLALLRSHVEMLNGERAEFGSGYHDSGLLFCWEDGRAVHPDTITARFGKIVAAAGLPKINLHDVRHSYATAGRDVRIDWKALSERIGHSDVAFTMRQYVQTDLEAHRQVATTLAELIIGGALPGSPMSESVHKSVHTLEQTSPGAVAPGP